MFCEKITALLFRNNAAEVERLVSIAYGELPPEYQAGMRLDTFYFTLWYLPLRRHLLAMSTHTLANAVRAGNEFLQIKSANEK